MALSIRPAGANNVGRSLGRPDVDLDGNVVFFAGAPIQPGYYRDLAAPNAGSLRGVVFLGGIYTETMATAPIALAINEYITDVTPPAFEAPGWHPSTPFTVQSSAFDDGVRDTVVLALGQYNPASGTRRVYDQMRFDTYYSDSPDRSPAEISHVDAVLDPARGQGSFKVEAKDASGLTRVVIASTDGAGVWSSGALGLRDYLTSDCKFRLFGICIVSWSSPR
ncbi:MAG: hypothetical protein NZ553_03825 [Caldilinea sp.]|nr:hypothetical protein [Caldilinea sp.]MDW8439581.1 hypothetical protein [Caldilineaceae bacterium]